MSKPISPNATLAHYTIISKIGEGGIANSHEYDVSPDGRRFVIGTLIGETKGGPPIVILNWRAALKK